MKNHIIRLALFLFPFVVFSQSSKPEKTGEDFEHEFTLQTGIGFTGRSMSKQLGQSFSDSTIKISAAPGLYLNYEYYIGPRFSVNACLGYATAKITNPSSVTMPKQRGTVISWSSRFLVHFLRKKSVKSDLYFGAGLGIGVWSFKPEKSYSQIVNGSNAQFMAPIYVGYRHFFNQNLGVTLELSSFRNSLVSAGITYRL